jgi:hypothetical protein
VWIVKRTAPVYRAPFRFHLHPHGLWSLKLAPAFN